MKRQMLLLAALLMVGLGAWAQKAELNFKPKKFQVYAVGFYNQENLFDTCHDAGKNDYEYMPAKGWNSEKYTSKLKNMSRALADMGTDVLPDAGCAFIGLAEVENANVLRDLTAQPPLKARNMQFCHIEGPDKRGIDCALLYNPALFTVKNVKLVPYVQELAKDSAFYTRGFLTVRGEMAGDDVAVIVCHWPSQFSGSFYRESGARQTKAVKDSLLRLNPEMKVFVMGDMNDDPTSKSMYEVLRAKPEISEVGEGDVYNPWYNILAKEAEGTLYYRGKWNLFDQIVLTPNLLNKDGKKKGYRSLKYWNHQVFRRDYLIQQEGRYKGAPLRTKAGGKWLNGYSDHLPVVLYLVKKEVEMLESHPFEPWLPGNAKLLMLGTFPPAEKRWCMPWYYPNFQNDMWRIFGIIYFDDKFHFVDVEHKTYRLDAIKEFLMQKGVAIYDTAQQVIRTKNTASDKDLQVVQPSDLDGMLRSLPDCTAVLTAGQLATKVFSDHFGIREKPEMGGFVEFEFENRKFRLYRMPSSSRAYPMAVEKKAEYYRKMFNDILEK